MQFSKLIIASFVALASVAYSAPSPSEFDTEVSHQLFARDIERAEANFLRRRELVRRTKNEAKCKKCDSDCKTLSSMQKQVSETYHKCFQANCLVKGVCY